MDDAGASPSIRTLRPGLWVVETAVEDFQVRGAVVGGSRRAVVFDTLARPRDMEGVDALVSGLPVTVVYSHGDWDHVWGTEGLRAGWDEILAQERCLPRFESELPGTLAEKRAQAPGEFEGVRLMPPTRTFQERQTLDLGDITMEITAAPGHTPDSAVAFIPEWNVLMAGDSIETPLPFLNPDSPLDRWVRGLEAWLAQLGNAPEASSPPLVIPSHGTVGGPDLIRSNVSYLKALIKGEDPEVSRSLSPFYRETHRSNLRIAASWREGGPSPT